MTVPFPGSLPFEPCQLRPTTIWANVNSKTAPAEGFRVTVGDASTTVWIDTETHELVCVEQKYTQAPGMNYTMEDIRLDESLDDHLFGLTPPPNYTHNITLDAGTGGSESQFVDFLRYWSTELAKDKTFPPVVLGPQMSKVMVDMAMQGKFNEDKLNQVNPNDMYQALIWLANLPEDTRWRYIGQNIVLRQSESTHLLVPPSRPISLSRCLFRPPYRGGATGRFTAIESPDRVISTARHAQ